MTACMRKIDTGTQSSVQNSLIVFDLDGLSQRLYDHLEAHPAIPGWAHLNGSRNTKVTPTMQSSRVPLMRMYFFKTR